MLPTRLQYNEEHTNLVFENISTIPLGLRAGIEIKRHQNLDEDDQDFSEDNLSHSCIVNRVRKHFKLPNIGQMRQRELEIIEGSKEAIVPIDKIS